MHRVLAASLICVTTIAALACQASYPAAPTDSTPVGFQIYFSSAVGLASVGNTYRFSAYVLRADGAYENVTMQATWSSSDPAVLRPDVVTAGFPPGAAFIAAAPGPADVIARYQGFLSSWPMQVIRSDRLVYPVLVITGVPPRMPGEKLQLGARINESATAFRVVTDIAAWSSSEAAIATVERGAVTAIAPGTVQITVADSGLSAFLRFSVYPRSSNP